MTTTLTPPIHSTFTGDSPRARRSDPVTSHEAADLTDTHKSIGWVLKTLVAQGPLADHELVLMATICDVKFTEQRIRTARASLVGMGLVEPAGIYRLTENNRRATVWQFKDAEDTQ